MTCLYFPSINESEHLNSPSLNLALGHTGPISGVAASVTGDIATAGYDNRCILWREEQAAAWFYHDHLVNHCAFSRNGRWLVTSSSDYSARVWDTEKLRLHAVLRGHADDVEMAEFSPDGERVATASRDGILRIYDVDGALIAKGVGHDRDVLSVAWTADGSRVLTSGDDGTVRKWRSTDAGLIDIIPMGPIETDTIVIASDHTIYAGDDDGRISIISGRGIEGLVAHTAGIKRLVIDEARGNLVSLGYDRAMKIWRRDAAGMLTLIRTTQYPPIVWARSAACIGADIITGTFGSQYARYRYELDDWDIGNVYPDRSLNAVAARNGKLLTIGDAGLLLEDGRRVADFGSLCNFILADEDSILTGGQLGKLYDGLSQQTVHCHRSPLNCAAKIKTNGRVFAVVGSYTGEGLLFRLSDAKWTFIKEVPLHDGAVKGIAAFGLTLVSVGASGAVSRHILSESGDIIQSNLLGSHAKIANGCTWIGEGRFASVGRDRKLIIWNETDFISYLTPHQHSIKSIAVSSAGRFVATGDYRGGLAVFDVEKEAFVFYSLCSRAGISSLAFDEQGDRFAGVAYDGSKIDLRARNDAWRVDVKPSQS
jgi:WD40 repeat protein